MRNFIDLWLGLACWILVLVPTFSDGIMNSKIYLILCKSILVLYVVCIVSYGFWGEAQDIFMFLLFHIFFLCVMISLFFLLKAFHEKANKKKVIALSLICSLFIVVLILTPWS